MSNTKALISAGDVEQLIKSISPSQDAIQTQSKVLSLTKPFHAITFKGDQDDAIEVCSLAKGFLNQIEKSRKEVKDPFLEAGKQIDRVARELADPVNAEYLRITKLISGYQAEEQRKIEAERAKLRAEQQAIENERRRLEQEKLAMARREEEAKRAAEAAKSKAAREKAAKELEAIEQANLEREFEQANLAERQEAANTTVIEDKPMEGAAASRDYEIEVVDPFLVIKTYPSFCDVTIKKNAVKEWAKTSWDGNPNQIPGLKITEKLTTAVRGVNPALTLK